MRVRRAMASLLALCLVAVALLATATIGSPSLSELDRQLALLEAEAADAPVASASAADILAAAQAYAASTVNTAVKKGETILTKAAAAGKAEGKDLGPAPPLSPEQQAAADKEKSEADTLAAAAKAKQETAELEAKVAATKAAAAKEAEARRLADLAQRKADAIAGSGFRGAKLRKDKRGVYGGVMFGVPKLESTPVATKTVKGGSPLTPLASQDKPDIYGNQKSCLKDIAAHFDEKDIFESKKIALLQQLSSTKSKALAKQIQSKLRSLETWHAMMQKKFLMSATEAEEHEKRVNKLFDEHLPQAMKDQLRANQQAKRENKPLPFPDAQTQALELLQTKKSEILRNQKLSAGGYKKMLRPQINNPGFPSMDPISTSLREKLYRNVRTENAWSTEATDIERAEAIVREAHKAHGDFVEGPIATPLLKGKLYHPSTEKLGVPHFLHNFPKEWQNVEEKVTMDDKMPVEQTYHTTW